jgi:hypothetical protein
MQSVSIFFNQDMFIVNIRHTGAYYPFGGTPSLEPRHETHTPLLPASQPPIGPLEVISGPRQNY